MEAVEDFDLSTIEEDLQRFQEEDVVKEALGRGVDLRQYARQIDTDLQALQAGSLPAFIEEAPATAELFEKLSDCDGILASMESILQGFQADLGGISDEIKHLQDESLLMNVKLKNRRAVEGQLFSVLEKLVVSDALIVGVCQGEVNEDYVQYVRELDEKLAYVRSQEPVGECEVAPTQILAAQEVEPQLDRLRLKVVGKVRVFLLEQIAALKKPKTNVQIMQQNVLLKYSYFVRFLAAHAPAVIEEVKGTYVDTMSRILYTLFKSYYANLTKLQEPGPAKDDLLAADEPSLPASVFAPPDAPPAGTASAKVAAREAALGEPDATPIIVHVARSNGTRFHFEAIFRSVQKHLMDSATSEFLFLLDFFEPRNNDLFNQIFAKTLSLCLENVENYLYGCQDVVALMLMIRTTQAHRLLMERRRVPCLDGYFDHVNMMLWPQFKKVFDLHLKSIKQPNMAKMGAARLDLKPHYVSRRYAQLASTVYKLSTSLRATDEMLPLNLAKLREAFVELLDALLKAALQSRQHHRALGTDKGRLIFRINNIDAVLAAFPEAAHAEDVAYFEELLAHDIALYIEEELSQSFSSIIGFLKRSEAAEEGGAPGDDSAASTIVQEFAAGWKASLDLLNTSVSNYFTSPDNAREILKQMLTQFLLYYTRFQDIIRKHSDQRIQNRLVGIQEIMDEMKSFSRGQM